MKHAPYDRRKKDKTIPISFVNALAAESTVDYSRTEVGFTRNQRQTEVGSTIDVNDGDTEDGDAEDGDPDGDDGYTADELWREEDLMEQFLESRKARNLEIGFYYRASLQSPSRSKWEGKNGTINHICDVFNIPKTKRRIVKRILNDQLTQEQLNKPYDGRDMRRMNPERPTVIEPGSVDEGLLADWMEDNHDFRQSTIFLNQHRTEEGRMPVERSAVMNAFDRMNPRISLVQKQVQGGVIGCLGRSP